MEFDRDQQGQRIALGQGTFGKVYLAHDRVKYKKYAVKEIPMRNPSYKADLENEIKNLARLKHKNSSLFFLSDYSTSLPSLVVSYYGTATDSTRKPAIFQVIMEYIDGYEKNK